MIPAIKAFRPEAGSSIHLDGWREVTRVDGYEIKVVLKGGLEDLPTNKKLFFINLGGYQSGKLEEQYHIILSVYDDQVHATDEAKKGVFYKTNTLNGAGSHIDEKHGVDVDDIYRIEKILLPEYKNKFHIVITPATDSFQDTVQLGYFKLDKIK